MSGFCYGRRDGRRRGSVYVPVAIGLSVLLCLAGLFVCAAHSYLAPSSASAAVCIPAPASSDDADLEQYNARLQAALSQTRRHTR